jgi:hypothetical protein
MIRKRGHTILLTVLSLLCLTVNLNAQYSSEAELKTAASKMFEAEDYQGSLKLYSQLLSNYPKDANYNYKYGASALFAKGDKEAPLKYLKFAVSKPNVDPIAYYFLAKAHHLNYNFDQAIVYYNKFKGTGSTKNIQKNDVDRQIEMCQNGKALLKSMVDIGVLDKKEIKETDFFRSYQLKGIEGKVTVKPDDFMSKLDKKKNENSLLYIGSTKEEKIIFSSFGKTSNSGRDLYSVERTSDGGWTEPVSLGLDINTNYDENYPFLHPDGKTLYFCSMGYNSMGGYDVFKSVFDASTGKWSTPENLDFPINTPGDDVMYVSDKENKLAYFASSRASTQGKLIVYHVTVDNKPNIHSMVKGFFLSESNPSMKSATIIVRDVDNDRRYGVYKTDDLTGEYFLPFPKNGGKFKILIETTTDAPVHSAIIELPALDDFRALKQELRLVGTGDEETLVVKNLFDESDEFDITDPLVVQHILKERAKLDVNTSEDELNNTLANSLNNALENQGNENSSYSKMSDDQIVNKTGNTASKIIDQAKTSKIQANSTYQIANKKSASAKELYNEAKNLVNNGDEEQANAKKREAAKLINEVVAALSIAKTLDNEIIERESDLEKVKSLQENINNDIDNGNRSAAEDNLKELDEIASATYHNKSAIETEEQIANNNLSDKEVSYKKTRDNVTELKNREFELKETINKLEAKKEETNKKSEKADIDSRIQALKIDIEDAKYDLGNAETKAAKAKKEYAVVKNQVETTKTVIASVIEGGSAEAPITESSKLQLENDIAYFEKEGLVGLYPTDEILVASSNETYNLEEHKDEYEIINDEGEIVDYNTTYSTKILDVDNESDPTERAKIIVKINESWIRDINDEIAIRKNQLKTETNSAKKTDLKEKIDSLEALKAEKQREVDESAELIAENSTSNESSNEVATTNTSENNSNEEVEIMNTDGSIIDYSSKYKEELAAFNGEDDFDSFTKKAAIHNNWASATGQEILIKKMELTEASEEDKNGIENEIAVLENNLGEQQEFEALYDMQAESMRTTEPIANNEEVNTNETANNNNNKGIDNYKEKYTAELEGFTGEDDFNSYTKKANIHTNWAEAIENEIIVKKSELTEASEEGKNGIENEIAVLENNLGEQQEFKALYDMQAESMRTTEPIANNEEVNTNEAANNNNTDNRGSDNYKEKYTAELEGFTGEDDFNSYTKKANIHINWAKAIENEIIAKKSELTEANEEDKNGIENEIAVLENNLGEQQEFEALYNMQAESMRTTEPIANNEEPENNNNNTVVANNEEPIANNEEVNTNETTNNNTVLANNEETVNANNETPVTNNEESTSEKNEAVTNNELAEENLTANNLNAPEDDFSNLKYNNKFNYKSTESQNTLAPVIQLKNEAKDLQDEAEVKLNTANGVSSQEEKDNIIAEADELTEKSNRKQEEVARVYENANRNEYYNNQAVISKLKTGNNDEYSNETLMTEMFIEESDNYYEEAKLKREAAANAPDFSAKESALQKAYELEMKALEKQKKAIDQLSDGSTEELYSNSENANESVVEEANTNNENTVTNNETRTENNEQPTTNIDQPVATSKEVSTEDQAIILGLEPSEIVEIKSKEEYKNYVELKKENRRLVKEAEVEYVEAEKFQEEANDQKQLGVSLNAMAAGAANEEDKAKKMAQIEKLNKMIADNEAESTKRKESAANKEVQAKEATSQSDLILINAEEDEAKNFTAIEKAETFDNEFLAEAMNRAVEPNLEEPIANNEEPVTNNEEIVANNEQPESNNKENTIVEPIINTEQSDVNTEETTVEEPIANNEETVTNNEEPVVNNEEPSTNTEEPVIEESVTNTVPENIDEIPTVLNKSIFVINNNQAAYNDNKRIPVSPKLPEGLVFKVQIGAFRKPIPQNHFKGFAPIMAEDAGNGITRYTAGLFKTFNMANEAKSSIRSIGYSDAFVVAFLNGKRININEARVMLDGGSVDEGNLAINNESPNNTSNEETTVENNSTEETTVENNSTNTTSNNTEEVKDGVSTDVRNIDGVFYAIQVGVYSKLLTAGQLNNVSPLNSERTSSGLIRYTSGVFKTLDAANAAKDRIRGLGITDAFVVAYNGGTKITVAEAAKVLTSNGSSTPVVEDPPVEIVPIEDTPVEDTLEEDIPVETTPEEDFPVETTPEEDTPIENTPVDTTFKNEEPGYEPKEDLKLEFKVKLGEYEDEVPVEDAGLFLKLTGRGVKNYEKDNKTVYTIGSFPDYESALDLQIEMKEMGVKNPETIVFKAGVEMILEEALELMKNNQ